MNIIPTEIIKNILSLLDTTSLVMISTTCNEFKIYTIDIEINTSLKCKIPLMNQCAYDGHLNVLKYLRGLEYRWDRTTCYHASRNGHLECLKYLHENDCEWSLYTSYAAAENGHLECLKYICDNGCEWV